MYHKRANPLKIFFYDYINKVERNPWPRKPHLILRSYVFSIHEAERGSNWRSLLSQNSIRKDINFRKDAEETSKRHQLRCLFLVFLGFWDLSSETLKTQGKVIESWCLFGLNFKEEGAILGFCVQKCKKFHLLVIFKLPGHCLNKIHPPKWLQGQNTNLLHNFDHEFGNNLGITNQDQKF